MTWTFNRNYHDLEQVAEWYPEYTAARAEVIERAGYPYNDEFRGMIPGIAGECEDTGIYLLQELHRRRKMDARVAAALGDGFRHLDTLTAVTKYAHVILYKPDGSGWHAYQDARLVPETKPRQAEVTGQIHALIPKGKRTRGVYVGGSGYAVLVKETAE